MKALIAVLAVVAVMFLVLVMPSVMNSITDFRTDTFTETYNINLGVGEDNSTVTLSSPLWNSNLAHVEVSSDLNTDTPTPYSYSITPRVLTVQGLTASDNRVLTVSYMTAGLEDYDAVENVSTKTPLFLWGIVIVAPIIALAYALKGVFG